MRTSCLIDGSKIMVHHNGELIWAIEKSLCIMVQSVDWTNAKDFTITSVTGAQYHVIVKREYLH